MQKIRKDPTLGANIRRLRLTLGLTQEQVAAKMQVLNCDISRSTYAKIEAGIANIKVSELIALSKIFHADMNEFFEGID